MVSPPTLPTPVSRTWIRSRPAGAPWPRSRARSFSELFGLAAPALHLPRYPLYRPEEAREGDYDYFFLRGERYLSCQAARFLLLGGDFVTLADRAAVDLSADVSGYWSGFFREHFAGQIGEVLRYSGTTGYRRCIAELPDLKVVAPQPYDSAHVPADRYYLTDPSLTVRLNAKGRMHELSHRVPRYERLSPSDFERDRWRLRWPLPFAVKLAEPSGGGDGVVLCREERQLAEARARFAGRQVKIEQLIEDIRHNYNVQIEIAPDGRLRYVGGSVQRVQGACYAGNCIDLQWVPPPRVAAVCDQAARAAAALGWHGVCGLDLIEDGDGEVWLIDPNFRLNGSTPFFLVRDYLADRYRRPYLATGYFRYPGSPDRLFDRFRREIERGELVPVGARYDPREDGVTRLFAAVANDGDPEKHAGQLCALAAKHLRSGIGL